MLKSNLFRELKRQPHSHKYDFGHLLVLGGSKTYSGSPTFNSLAAYRSGVDLVTTVSPKRSADIIATFSPSIITRPLEGEYFRKKHLSKVENLKENVDAVVVGGGMGKNKETFEALRTFLMNLEIPTVIDADAITAIAKQKNIISKKFLLTPHAGEFRTLTGEKVVKDLAERKKQVENFTDKHNCTLLLKGNTDLISTPDGIYENDTGNEYMTVGGTGDILAGIVGSFLAQGMDPSRAAFLGARVSGKAGEAASKDNGIGTMPDDILMEIPKVIKQMNK